MQRQVLSVCCVYLFIFSFSMRWGFLQRSMCRPVARQRCDRWCRRPRHILQQLKQDSGPNDERMFATLSFSSKLFLALVLLHQAFSISRQVSVLQLSFHQIICFYYMPFMFVPIQWPYMICFLSCKALVNLCVAESLWAPYTPRTLRWSPLSVPKQQNRYRAIFYHCHN